MESAYTGFSHSLVKYQKSHSFNALTRSISDTSATRVKVPYARAFHELISMFRALALRQSELKRQNSKCTDK